MNCCSYFTVVKWISSDVNVTFFSPVGSPLIFYDPFIWIISNKKYSMINLCIWFAWKRATTVILPIISTNGKHYRSCLKHVDDLRIFDVIIWITSLISIGVFDIFLCVGTHTLVAFLSLIWDIKLIRNSFFVC